MDENLCCSSGDSGSPTGTNRRSEAYVGAQDKKEGEQVPPKDHKGAPEPTLVAGLGSALGVTPVYRVLKSPIRFNAFAFQFPLDSPLN